MPEAQRHSTKAKTNTLKFIDVTIRKMCERPYQAGTAQALPLTYAQRSDRCSKAADCWEIVPIAAFPKLRAVDYVGPAHWRRGAYPFEYEPLTPLRDNQNETLIPTCPSRPGST